MQQLARLRPSPRPEGKREEAALRNENFPFIGAKKVFHMIYICYVCNAQGSKKALEAEKKFPLIQ